MATGHDVSAQTHQEKIAGWLMEAVANGEFFPGDAVPSDTKLMERFGVSRGTVTAALKILRDSGKIVSYRGRGRQFTARSVMTLLNATIPSRLLHAKAMIAEAVADCESVMEEYPVSGKKLDGYVAGLRTRAETTGGGRREVYLEVAEELADMVRASYVDRGGARGSWQG